MTDGIVKSVFNNHNITTILYKGEPVWMAHEVAAALEYSETNKLTRKLGNEWSKDLRSGVDYVVLKEEELAKFKELLQELRRPPESGGRETTRFNSLILFKKSGIQLACTMSKTPVAREFRFHLVDYVLPQIELGMVELKSKEEVELAKAEARRMRELDIEEVREGRLMRDLDIKEKDLDIRERNQKADTIENLVVMLHDMGHIDSDVSTAYKVTASEIRSGMNLTHMRPALKGGEWKTPDDISKETGFTLQKIGRVISKIGCLRGNTKYCKTFLWTDPKSSLRKRHMYSEEAVELIMNELYGGQMPLV